jgi:TolB-like protein
MLLRHFIENPGRLIDRDEIMRTVWPGIFVLDDRIAQCVRDIRHALGDSRLQVLRRAPRRGYLFAAEVLAADAAAPAAPAVEEPAHDPATAARPSIAVLPFNNVSGDPEQEYFTDGVVEEITTALAHIRWLFVIARNSSFTYKGRAVDVRQVVRELDVRYVLEGSVRKAGSRVRITGQPIDSATGAHIWADRFDGALDDIFELQDRVASSVAGVIEPELRLSAETAHALSLARQALAAKFDDSDTLWQSAVVLHSDRLLEAPRGKNARRQNHWRKGSRADRRGSAVQPAEMPRSNSPIAPCVRTRTSLSRFGPRLPPARIWGASARRGPRATNCGCATLS